MAVWQPQVEQGVWVGVGQQQGPEELTSRAEDDLVGQHLPVVLTHQGDVGEVCLPQQAGEGLPGVDGGVAPHQTKLHHALHQADAGRLLSW